MLDKSPVSGPRRGPPSYNKTVWRYYFSLFWVGKDSKARYILLVRLGGNIVAGKANDTRLTKGNLSISHKLRGFPDGSVVKNQPADAGDIGLIPGSGRSSGGGNGNPL